MVLRMQRNWITRALLVEIYSGTTTWENSLAITYKIHMQLPRWPGSCTQTIYPAEGETYAHTKTPNTNAHSSFVYKSAGWKVMDAL